MDGSHPTIHSNTLNPEWGVTLISQPFHCATLYCGKSHLLGPRIFPIVCKIRRSVTLGAVRFNECRVRFRLDGAWIAKRVDTLRDRKGTKTCVEFTRHTTPFPQVPGILRPYLRLRLIPGPISITVRWRIFRTLFHTKHTNKQTAAATASITDIQKNDKSRRRTPVVAS